MELIGTCDYPNGIGRTEMSDPLWRLKNEIIALKLRAETERLTSMECDARALILEEVAKSLSVSVSRTEEDIRKEAT